MMGGGVQDVVDNYVAGALLSVEAALDDEMNKMENLNVRCRHTCPAVRACLTQPPASTRFTGGRPGQD